LKDRAALAWEALERDDVTAPRRSEGTAGGGGGANSATLVWLLASRSHWLTGRRPEELRIGDVVRLMQSYGELLAEGAAAGGGMAGTAG
jgi:hypothetical protein